MPVESADVAAVRARQRGLGVPEAFEWVAEVTPSLRLAAEAAERQDAAALLALRTRLRSGMTVMASVADDQGPLAVGSHQPVRDVTEVVGVATLPALRRRGLGTVVTHALAADALRRGCDIIFLSADDDAVARLYARIGFRRVGTALIAEPHAAPTPEARPHTAGIQIVDLRLWLRISPAGYLGSNERMEGGLHRVSGPGIDVTGRRAGPGRARAITSSG
jgi:ribosomal protein S18 acetylase RimI-like enzyme